MLLWEKFHTLQPVGEFRALEIYRAANVMIMLVEGLCTFQERIVEFMDMKKEMPQKEGGTAVGL